MKKMSVLVKQVLMSTLTVGIIAMSITACSDKDELLPESATAEGMEAAASQNDNPIQAYGFVYTDFITPNDIQILNADTTEIAISKALADKKGITNFVNHPMGIKQSFEDIPYLRRAIKQELVGDQYILTVVRAGVAEVLAGQNVELNTGIYVNPNAGATRAGSADKYIDSQNRIHPVAVHLQRLPGEEGAVTRSGASAGYGVLTAEQILNGEEFIPQTRGFKEIKDFLIRFIGSGGHATIDDMGKIAKITGTLTPKDLKIKVGPDKNDTLVIHSRVPYDISLGYTLKLDAQFKVKKDVKSIFGMFVNPFSVFSVDTKLFESRLDGAIKVTPEVSIGIGAKAEVPKEQQNFKIASLGNYVFDFQVGPVPVPVVLQPALYLHFDASIEGRIYTGIEYKYESTFYAGMKYQKGDGWDGYADYTTQKNDFDFLPPRGTVKGKAGAGIMLGVDVMVGGVAGPSFSVGPMVTANMDMKIAPWDKVPFSFKSNIKFGLHGRAGAKLKLFTLELADWQTDIVFGPEKTLWSFECQGDFFSNDGGSNKFIEEVNKIKKETEAEVAKNAENQKNWNTFVEMMKKDLSVQSALCTTNASPLNNRNPFALTTVGMGASLTSGTQKLESALNKTYSEAMHKYGEISPSHFSDMKNILLNCIKNQK